MAYAVANPSYIVLLRLRLGRVISVYSRLLRGEVPAGDALAGVSTDLNPDPESQRTEWHQPIERSVNQPAEFSVP